MSAAERPAPPPALRIAAARGGLELRLFFREPAQVIFSFAYPVLMMLIFASSSGTTPSPAT